MSASEQKESQKSLDNLVKRFNRRVSEKRAAFDDDDEMPFVPEEDFSVERDGKRKKRKSEKRSAKKRKTKALKKKERASETDESGRSEEESRDGSEVSYQSFGCDEGDLFCAEEEEELARMAREKDVASEKSDKRRKSEIKKAFDTQDPVSRKIRVESALLKHKSEKGINPGHVEDLCETYMQGITGSHPSKVLSVSKPLDEISEHPCYRKIEDESKKSIKENFEDVFQISGVNILSAYMNLRSREPKGPMYDGMPVETIPVLRKSICQELFVRPHGGFAEVCMFGMKCLALQIFGDFLGGPLIRIYTEEEVNMVHANVPVESQTRCCLVCERLITTMLCQETNMAMIHGIPQIGFVRYLIGVGEYCAESMIPTSAGKSNGQVTPLVAFDKSTYKRVYAVLDSSKPDRVTRYVYRKELDAFRKKYPYAQVVPALLETPRGYLKNVSTSYFTVPKISPYTRRVFEPEQRVTCCLPVMLYFRSLEKEDLSSVFDDYLISMRKKGKELKACYNSLLESGVIDLGRFGFHAKHSQIDFDRFKFYVIAFMVNSVYVACTSGTRISALGTLPDNVKTYVDEASRGYSRFFDYVRCNGIPSDKLMKSKLITDPSTNRRTTLFLYLSPNFGYPVIGNSDLIGLKYHTGRIINKEIPPVILEEYYKGKDSDAIVPRHKDTVYPTQINADSLAKFLETTEIFGRGAEAIVHGRSFLEELVERDNQRYKMILDVYFEYAIVEFKLCLDSISLEDDAFFDKTLRDFSGFKDVLPQNILEKTSVAGFDWRDHLILFCIGLRVSVFQELYELERRSKRKIRVALLLAMNSHLDLVLYMASGEDRLADRKLKLDDPFHYCDPYKLYYPYTWREKIPGDTPDYVVDLFSVTWSNQQMPITEAASLQKIWFKLPWRCCHNRGFKSQLQEACISSVEIRKYVFDSLAFSLKGLYKFCTSAPRFPVMLQIHSLFSHYNTEENFETALRFISNNKNLCTNALAENMYYLLGYNPCLESILKRIYPTWFFDDIISCMNMARSVGDYKNAEDYVFKDLRRSQKVIYRHVQESFVSFYVKYSNTFPCVLKPDFVSEREMSVEDRKDVVDITVRNLPQSACVDLRMLRLFLCSEETIKVVSAIHAKHKELHENKRSKTTKQIHNTELARHFKSIQQEDRVIVDYFFNAWNQSKVVTTLRIRSDEFVQGQIDKLKRNFGEHPSMTTTHLAIAPCCGSDVRTVTPRTNKGPTVGTVQTTYNLGTHKLECDARSHRTSSNNKRETEAQEIRFYEAVGSVVQIDKLLGTSVLKKRKKTSSKLVAAKNNKKHKKRVGNIPTPLTVQPCCGCINSLTIENYSPSGQYLCPVCRKFSAHHQSFVKPSCVCCERVIKKNFVSLPTKYICRGCGQYHLEPYCPDCEKSIPKTEYNTLPATDRAMFYVLLDDTIDEYVPCYICRECYKPWKSAPISIFRLSVLRKVYNAGNSVNRNEEAKCFCRDI